MELSHDDIRKLAHNLVYQVAYAFYDTPYIILIKLLVLHEAVRETDLASMVGLNSNEIRKYLGTLHVHRLIKRYVNKEKQPVQAWMGKRDGYNPPGRTSTDGNKVELRIKDVIYWYIDYREFANVVKYRLAMVRKGIDEKIKQEAGNRGYICPNCGKLYEPLEMGHLFSPQTNSFNCEVCSTELIEHDPSLIPANEEDEEGNTNQDMMQRFNLATASIRDALKTVEGIMLPSVNILVWIANNVKMLGDNDDGTGVGGQDGLGKRKIEVVVGDEGEERERLERERLAEEQRSQNALPIWHTHSTVTGSATSLGISSKNSSTTSAHVRKTGKEMDDVALSAHYASLVDDEDEDLEDVGAIGGDVGGSQRIDTVPSFARDIDSQSKTGGDDEKQDGDDGDGDGDGDELEDRDLQEGQAQGQADGSVSGEVKMIMVGGVAKPLAEITEEDEEEMSPDEYTAYYEAANGS